MRSARVRKSFYRDFMSFLKDFGQRFRLLIEVKSLAINLERSTKIRKAIISYNAIVLG